MSRLPFILVGLAAVVSAGCNEQVEAKKSAPPPMKVLYVTPSEQKVTEYEEFTGRIAPLEMVEVRARVSGYLQEVKFTDGEDVEEKEVLALIDDRSFKAEELRTAAAIAQMTARNKRLERQLARSERLLQGKAVSQDEYETIKYDFQESTASLAAANAAHELAKLNVEFASVKAPLKGRIGRRLLDVGNLVTADETVIATIMPLDKLYVYFDMDERTVLKLRRLISAGVIKRPQEEQVTIDIALADSPEFSLQGEVDFQDTQIDAATGTLRLRAIVENPDGLLSPGMFARIRYPIGKPTDSLLVPEESLGSDQGQPFVYVIGEDDKVAMRRVEPGPQVGEQRVIRSGLEMGERIAVTGLQRLRRDTKVTPELRVTETTAGAESVAAKESGK